MEFVKDLDNCWGIYREKVTDVLYLRNWYSEKSGLTVMLHPKTGKPLTWTKYQELEKIANSENIEDNEQ